MWHSTALSVASVTAPMLLMPTLSELQEPDSKRPWVLPFTRETVESKFIYSQNRADRKRQWWTYFTYGFIHKDTEHLVANLTMLLPSAVSVQRTYGTIVLWFTFFGGIVFGAGPSELSIVKDCQHERNIRSILQMTGSEGTAAELWNNGVAWGAKKMAPIVGYYAEYIGCSTGCFALLSLDACHSIEVLISVLFGGAESTVDGVHEEDVDRLVLSVSSHAMSCYFMAGLVYKQYISYTQSDTNGMSLTDHSGHILGMAFGVFTYAALKVGSLFYKRRKITYSSRRK